MGRGRGTPEDDADEILSPPRREPFPLDATSLLAGIGPGVTLESGSLPPDRPEAPAADDGVIGLDELGRMLRCGEATIRRLIRTAVLEPVESGGHLTVRRADVERYLAAIARRKGRKPGE